MHSNFALEIVAKLRNYFQAHHNFYQLNEITLT